MYIERDITLYSVPDFIKNVKPKLNDNLVAEEVYKNLRLVGWNIVELIKKN